MQPKSVIVLSGGQDSITTYYKAKTESEVVGAIHFNYRQQHGSPERNAISQLELLERHAFKTLFVDLAALSVVAQSALNVKGGDVSAPHPLNNNLPASFVPGRNLIMLTLAAVYAQSVGATQIWTGVCETDYSGYPDCRESTIQSLEQAINRGLDPVDPIIIMTPLMHLDKADTFRLAEDLGVLQVILTVSHTCYIGDHTTQNSWGFGCGKCPACEVRKNGYYEFMKRYHTA